MKETVFTMDKKAAGEVELSEEIFTSRVNKALIYETVKMHLANRRAGTAATRNHRLVSGTTAKMYRQKGTGRARHGDTRTNIFVGGGKAFGPHPRDYGYRMPAKARKGGLRAALSLKRNEGRLLIVDDLKMESIKTKDAVAVLSNLGVKSGLIVVDGQNANLEKSVRNIPGVKFLRWEGLNAHDVIRYEHVIVTVPALNRVQEVLKP
ncbi:MAG TPA: 50S ribosomal protein L4 [bacterium]|nr:50S ribosomal protein L4 [bacterium]